MDLQSSVEQELHKIHRKRNRSGYLIPILTFIASTYLQTQLHADLRWMGVGALITLGTVLRILMGETFFDQWSKKVPWAIFLNLLAFFLLGVGLALHFADVVFHYGAGSKNAFYVLLIMSAFIIGSSTSLIADLGSYRVYVLTIAIGIIATFFLGAGFSEAYIIVNIIIFLLFSLWNHKVGCQQLRELLSSEITNKNEKERLKNLINAVPGLVSLIDKEGVVYGANQTTLSFFPDIIGKKLGTIDPHGDWENFILNFMQTEKASDVTESKRVEDGQEMYGLLNVARNPDGGVITVCIVINELVEARKKIREQEAKAQYSAKLASLGEMAAGIAHEVNNPLTIIQGTANIIRRLLDQEPLDRENLKMLAGKVVSTSERISKTVKSLKALSRSGEDDPKVPVSIKRVIDICMDVCEQRLKNNSIKLIASDIPEDIFIKAREVQLSQVLLNLLNNSVDAVKLLEERWIKINVQKVNSWIDVTVSDSGKGIPKEIQNKIMDPFFTTKDVNEGTGLGLSISKTIIKENGGELSLLPDEPHTTFRIRLPELC